MRAALTIAVWLGAVAGAGVLDRRPSQQDFSAARNAAAALPQMHSLLVSHRGRLALEYYAPGHRATRPANIKSASKSIISTLVGIAIDRKLIGGVRDPIARWFPELRKDADKRKQLITI